MTEAVAAVPSAKLLLVDDEPRNLVALESLLAAPDRELVIATSGRDALRRALEHEFAAILLDVQMPGMDGFETAQLLRQRERTRHTPILFLTASDSNPVELRGYEAGAVDYLVKPLDPAILKAKVGIFVELYQRSAEARYLAAIVASSEDAIIAMTLDGIISSWNSGAERLYGHTAEEAVGQSIDILVPPDRAAEVTSLLERIRRGERIAGYETVRICKDGRKVDVALSLAPISSGASGRPIGISTVARDVTALKRAGEALRAQAGLLDLAQDAILVRDAETGSIRFWSRGAEELYGWSRQEAVGRNSEELLRPTFQSPPSEIQAELNRQGRWDGEAEHARRDGTRVPVASRWAIQRDAQGQPDAVLEINTDITEWKKLDRMKDELVSVVSHELRTPLASLVGFTELLLTRDYDESRRREFLETMLKEGQRLAALIGDFLDLQRMEAGLQDFHPRPADVRSLLDAALASAGEDPAHPIQLDVPEGLPQALADPDRVQQVLLNLLSNARKYSPEGGAISVSARQVNGSVQLDVADRGLGLPPEALPRLFQRFYRVDTADRRQIGGTGLGLAIVRKIVEAHGGRIWADSEGPGRGSVFRFTLPVAGEAEVTDSAQAPGLQSVLTADGAYLLVVEDSDAFSGWLVETLTAAGYRVEVAHSAEAALAAVERNAPAAVLLNLDLGRQLDGWDFLSMLRRRPENAGVPVVVVSGREEQARGRALGVADYLVKPVRSHDLLASVGRLHVRPRDAAVLVVEDHTPTRRVVLGALEGAGFQVKGVRSGEEALVRLDEHDENYGLMVLDLGLPGMDGFDVLQAVRSNPRTRRLPVIILTGRDLDGQQRQYLTERAVDVLQKGKGLGVPVLEAVSRALGDSTH